MAETELERAEKRFAQARARLQALRNREATKQRKLDTRRKVILGGALVDLASRDDRAAEMLERLVRNLVREQDRAAFNGWDRRADESGAATADEAGSVADAMGADGGDTGSVEVGADEVAIAAGAVESAEFGGAGTEDPRISDEVGAEPDFSVRETSTRRLIIPRPNLHKEFLARRRAGVSEE